MKLSLGKKLDFSEDPKIELDERLLKMEGELGTKLSLLLNDTLWLGLQSATPGWSEHEWW